MYAFWCDGSNNQPRRHPFSIHSCILSCAVFKRSDLDITSATKSGHNGTNSSCSSSASLFHRSIAIHATSGDRIAPFASKKPVEESNAIPSFAIRFQLRTSPPISRLRNPDFPPDGDITMRSPLLVRSIRISLLLAQRRKSCLFVNPPISEKGNNSASIAFPWSWVKNTKSLGSVQSYNNPQFIFPSTPVSAFPQTPSSLPSDRLKRRGDRNSSARIRVRLRWLCRMI